MSEADVARPFRVLTSVTCDVFTAAHVRFFAAIKARWPGCHLQVIVDDDTVAAAIHGYPPALPLKERMEIVAACRHVDDVIAGHGAYPAEWIAGCDVFVRGGKPWTGPLPAAYVPHYRLARRSGKLTFIAVPPATSPATLVERLAARWVGLRSKED